MSALRQKIEKEIRERGPIPFSRYMELCLYDPQLGYYSRNAAQFGKAGDFYTASDVHAVFGRLLARQFEEMWRGTSWTGPKRSSPIFSARCTTASPKARPPCVNASRLRCVVTWNSGKLHWHRKFNLQTDNRPQIEPRWARPFSPGQGRLQSCRTRPQTHGP